MYRDVTFLNQSKNGKLRENIVVLKCILKKAHLIQIVCNLLLWEDFITDFK